MGIFPKNTAGGIINGLTPEQLREVLQDEGYKAKLETLESGSPVIRSAVSGWNYTIYFYGTETVDEPATSIQFSLGVTVESARPQTLEMVNSWNAKKRFLKCYTDEDGDLWADLDFVVRDVTLEFVKTKLAWWESLMRDLAGHMSGD